jgi:hypothetical protein
VTPLPSRSELMKITEQVCEDEGVPTPSILFGDSSVAKCHEEFIQLPQPEWIAKYHGLNEPDGLDPHESAVCYQLTLLHELAHWIEQAKTGETRHSAFMYATFFRLVETGSMSLDYAFELEQRYKPRASKQGWKLYQSWLQEAA